MVTAQNSLLENDALSLQVDGLKEISELELNRGQFTYASGDFLVHGPGDLQECIDALAVQVECTFESALLVSLLG